MRVPPINRQPFTSPNAGRSTALSSEPFQLAAPGEARALSLKVPPPRSRGGGPCEAWWSGHARRGKHA
jgi:hypothetical protein